MQNGVMLCRQFEETHSLSHLCRRFGKDVHALHVKLKVIHDVLTLKTLLVAEVHVRP